MVYIVNIFPVLLMTLYNNYYMLLKIFFLTLTDPDLWSSPFLAVDVNQRNQVFSSTKINPTSPQVGLLGRAGIWKWTVALAVSWDPCDGPIHHQLFGSNCTGLCYLNMQPVTISNPQIPTFKGSRQGARPRGSDVLWTERHLRNAVLWTGRHLRLLI